MARRRSTRQLKAAERRESARRFRELMACVNKARYGTEDGADAAVREILVHSDRDRRPVRSYSCTVCGEWHLTSRAGWEEAN